ncbi:hypothetical protein FALBO_15696 [Fusarium albosuccineum]|uniref:F-box domain-containing protein n=1 Tax=Fusarium albosuccineum TaxID=1237068 RepID=A0A8H4KS31_9HYPO|nr:hypothetical protein FALBO_15696 [Fusarium albosuccineum]
MVQTQDQQRVMNPASLPNLFPELLRLIFGYFCLHCCGGFREPYWVEPDDEAEQSASYLQGRQTLCTLSLVSRRFRDIAQDILHHEYLLGYTDLRHPEWYSWDGRLTAFMRTVASRRDLARLVRTVFIHPASVECIGLDEAWAALNHSSNALGFSLSETWEQRKSDPREHPGRSDYDFRQKFFLGQLDALDRHNRLRYNGVLPPELYAALIALLPNLDHLIFRNGVGYTDVPMTAMKALGITSLPLRTLEVGCTPNNLLAVAPDLEVLTYDDAGFLPQTSKLKSLRHRKVAINEHNFRRIASCAPVGLSSFVYEASRVQMASVDLSATSVVQPRVAVRQLARHRETLKSLHLDLRFRTRFHRDTTMEPMPSLGRFTALEELFIVTNSVYNNRSLGLPDDQTLVKLLPSSIVSLSIASPEFPPHHERVLKGLAGLAEHKRQHPERFPQLKWLRCDVKQVFEDNSVKDMLSEVGVDLEYQEFPRPDWSYKREPLALPVPATMGTLNPNELDPNMAMPLPDPEDEEL